MSISFRLLVSVFALVLVSAVACGSEDDLRNPAASSATPTSEPAPALTDGVTVQNELTEEHGQCATAVDTGPSESEVGWIAPYLFGSGALPVMLARPFGTPIETWPDDRPEIKIFSGLKAQSRAMLGDVIELLIELRRNPEQVTVLPIEPDLPYDFVVLRSDGTEVWRWSNHVDEYDVPESLEMRTQAPFNFAAEWDLTNDNGEALEPGFYWVSATLYTEAPFRMDLQPSMLIIGETPKLADLIKVETHAPDSVVKGDQVNLKMCVTNTSNDLVPLQFGVSVARFKVTTPQGWPVWPSSEGQVIPAILLGGVLAPGQTGVHDFVWDLTDLNGAGVSPGEYLVSGGLMAAVADISNGEELVWSEPSRLVMADS